ncbi:HAD-IB family hydrolase [Clostridiales bacterium COT073_COT-073]|nr:HAD-IB family hydrolase [Clostridiales bacterium COT073_COT-073]
MKTAAFFDIDGTLYREGLITSIFKKFIKSDIIDESVWYQEVRDKYNQWDKRVGNYDDYLLKMAEIYIEVVRGLHQSQVEYIANKVVEQKGDKVYIYTRDKILWHKQQGHMVITVSGSPYELVRAMSIKHGFDAYRGTIYELDQDNRYTGNLFPLWDSASKQKEIMKLVEEYEIDLATSYAYGDTAGDFLMLKSVGNPVAMNPTKELLQKIMQDQEMSQKAKIVVERKDNIYQLSPDMLKSGSVL